VFNLAKTLAQTRAEVQLRLVAARRRTQRAQNVLRAACFRAGSVALSRRLARAMRRADGQGISGMRGPSTPPLVRAPALAHLTAHGLRAPESAPFLTVTRPSRADDRQRTE